MFDVIRFEATSEGQFGTLQTFIAPQDGTYTITAAGAEGSGGNILATPTLAPKGGLGGILTLDVELVAGEAMWLLVGQAGTALQGTSRDGTSGGGGGGTFVFKLIDAIKDSRYQFTKSGQSFEATLIAPGGGGSNDASYQGRADNGFDGNTDIIYTPTNYISPNASQGNPATSYSRPQGMGISQFTAFDGGGGLFTFNSGRSIGGYGGGGSNDDARCAGGGWYGLGFTAYGWAVDNSVSSQAPKNAGHGWVEIQMPELVFPDLVYDRTQADVNNIKVLLARSNISGWDNFTPAEKEYWQRGDKSDGVVRGAYNYSDYNRVGRAIAWLSRTLSSHGYIADVAPKTDWTEGNIPTPEQLDKYLDDIRKIRAVLTLLPLTPPAPDTMRRLGWRAANDIEKILADIENTISRLYLSSWVSGEAYTGEAVL